jgi:hypothetical protein
MLAALNKNQHSLLGLLLITGTSSSLFRIRSLPMEERFIAVKIEASTLPDTIRNILSTLEAYNSNFTTETNSLL